MKTTLPRNREKALTVFLLCAAAYAIFFCFSGCGKKESGKNESQKLPDDIYSLEVLKSRKKKDLFLLSDPKSPLKATDRENFKGLPYYPPTYDFIFSCVLQHHPASKEISIQTSKNKPRTMLNIGYVSFNFHQQTYRLQVYVPKDTTEDGMYYFIPFTDRTNGTETYHGGRFLDFDTMKNDSLFLDFNYAYNPYCAYNEKYDCPIPPAENHLQIPIYAGEKLFRKDSY